MPPLNKMKISKIKYRVTGAFSLMDEGDIVEAYTILKFDNPLRTYLVYHPGDRKGSPGCLGLVQEDQIVDGHFINLTPKLFAESARREDEGIYVNDINLSKLAKILVDLYNLKTKETLVGRHIEKPKVKKINLSKLRKSAEEAGFKLIKVK